MKWSFATVGIIILGLFGVSIILLFQNVTTSNESDYYLLKEVTEAAMIDAIDIPYYRETGELKIIREKFVENFTRRFAESAMIVSGGYTIDSYDIMETPPKVSVVISTHVGKFSVAGNASDYNVQNKLDAILEYVGTNTFGVAGNPYVSGSKSIEYYAVFSKGAGNSNFSNIYSMKLPSELVAPNIKNVKITNVEYIGDTIDTQGELGIALMNQELSYNSVWTDYFKSIDEYAYNVSSVTGDYYNCGLTTGEYVCNDDNKYYVKLTGNTSDTSKENVIFKYRVTWSYDEYEFAS